MLMHTKVAGDYDGPEEVMDRNPCYTEINVTSNYAPTCNVEIVVVDSNNAPVQGAKVEFKLYNYAEFYTVATTTTDSQGRIISGSQPTCPIVGAGSVILGLVLALTPCVFVNGLIYILGASMILGGINQLMSLIAARRLGSIPFGFWVAPSLILITGLFVILRPMETAGLPLLILGWCSLLYGVTELINALKIRSVRKEADRMRDERESQRLEEESVAEEISSELNHTESETASDKKERTDADEYDNYSAD
jgi:uncharacterized membrane protein HdeD (DUF308 family)